MAEPAQGLIQRARHLLERIARAAQSSYEPRDVGEGIPALDAALSTGQTLLARRAAGVDGRTALGIITLLSEVGQLRHDLLVHQLAQRHERMHRLDEALGRLRAAQTVGDFVERLPEEVVGLGYVRSLYSSAEGMQWVAQSAHSLQGPAESHDLLEAGRQDPLRDLRDLYEAEMVRERRPILHQGIRRSRRVHPEIIRVTESEAYVAAPLILGGAVRAFVSVDVNSETGTVDEFDRDFLGLLTTGAALALEGLGAAGPRPGAADDEPGGRGEGAGVGTPVEALTPREREILQLVARGLSNAGIAERLVISEGTAKTHVKNILRKLGAANRTEAASLLRGL